MKTKDLLFTAAVCSGLFTAVNPAFAQTWTQTSSPTNLWRMACSADGSKLVAAGYDPTNTYSGAIYTSTDSGMTWRTNDLPDSGNQMMVAVASSADGTELVAVSWPIVLLMGTRNPGRIYTSTNSGTTWISPNGPREAWQSVASSADGTKLAAASKYSEFGGSFDASTIYTSADSGATWTLNSLPYAQWYRVASSADGSKLFAGSLDSSIYTSQSTPRPALNVAPSAGNLVLSWIVPSMNFVLQQNSSLASANWTDVAATPILNLTNLQYQVTIFPTNSRSFYRLAGR